MTIHWKDLVNHFVMVPLVFLFLILWIFLKKPQVFKELLHILSEAKYAHLTLTVSLPSRKVTKTWKHQKNLLSAVTSLWLDSTYTFPCTFHAGICTLWIGISQKPPVKWGIKFSCWHRHELNNGDCTKFFNWSNKLCANKLKITWIFLGLIIFFLYRNTMFAPGKNRMAMFMQKAETCKSSKMCPTRKKSVSSFIYLLCYTNLDTTWCYFFIFVQVRTPW
jgi:hypothetical protein